MSAPTQTEIENAIHAWVVAATGLAASQVIWRNQNGPRPARPFVMLALGGVTEVGTPWVRNVDNPTPTPGAEIVYTVRGVERLRVTFEAVTDHSTGNTTAVNYLRLIRGKLNVPSVRAALWAIPIGVASFGDVAVLDFLENDALRLGRAQMDCGIYVPTEFTETGTIIETTDGSVLLNTGDAVETTDFDLNFEP